MDQHHRTHALFAHSLGRQALLLLGMVFAGSAQAASHFVTFINDSDRTITSIQAAAAGTRHWHVLNLGGPLVGGESGQVTVRFDNTDACQQDLSVTYRGIAPLTIMGFNVCRNDRLYLGKALAKARRNASTQAH